LLKGQVGDTSRLSEAKARATRYGAGSNPARSTNLARAKKNRT